MSVRPVSLRTRFAAAAALITLAAGSLAACTAPQDPLVAFSQGYLGLTSGKDLGVTVDADVSAADVARSLPSEDESAATVGKVLADGTLRFDIRTRGTDINTTVDPNLLDGSMTFDLSGAKVIITSGESQIGLRADAEALATATGLADAEQLQMMTAMGPAWLKDLVAGKWLAMDKATVSELTKDLPVPVPSQAPDPKKQMEALLKNTTAAFGADSEFGKEIILTVKVKPYLQELGAAGNDPEQQAEVDKIPADATLVVKAWNKDNVLSRMSIDLDQLKKLGEAMDDDPAETPAATPLPGALILTFEKVAQPVVPENPTVVTAEDVEMLIPR